MASYGFIPITIRPQININIGVIFLIQAPKSLRAIARGRYVAFLSITAQLWSAPEGHFGDNRV